MSSQQLGLKLVQSLESAGVEVSGDPTDCTLSYTSSSGSTHNCSITISGNLLMACSSESMDEMLLKDEGDGEGILAVKRKILKMLGVDTAADVEPKSEDEDTCEYFEELQENSGGSYMYAQDSTLCDTEDNVSQLSNPPQAMVRDVEKCRNFLTENMSAFAPSNLAKGNSNFEPSVTVRSVGEGFWVTVTTKIPKCISENVAKAWGVNLDLPLEIRIQFDSRGYPGHKAPKVQLFQHPIREANEDDADENTNGMAAEHCDGRFPLGQHLTRALNGYLQRRWRQDSITNVGYFVPLDAADSPQRLRSVNNNDNAGASSLRSAIEFVGSRLFSTKQDTPSDDQEALELPNPSKADSSPLTMPNITHERRERLIAHRAHVVSSLRLMGFSQLECEEAAARYSKTVDATQFLLNPAQFLSGQGSATQPACSGVSGIAKDKDEGDDRSPKKYVHYSDDNGFIVHVVQYVLHRFPSASNFCVLCDMPHVFEMSMLRPAVCSRALCTFAFSDLKVGQDSAESVATDAGVLDLLVNVFRAAVLAAAEETNSERAKRMLTPYPSVRNPDSRVKQLAFDPEKPDYCKLKKVAESLPTMRELINGAALASALDKRDPLAHPLFNWIVSSNRSFMVKIDPGRRITSMQTDHQYLLLMSTPEKEATFRQLKGRYGSRWAFHGSRTNNWHSILRNGLMNMSNTSYQLNGAAHGSGVYFAPESATSLGYSGFHLHNHNDQSTTPKIVGNHPDNTFLNDSQFSCLALCEIINGSFKDHGWCWTVENDGNIMTRFLFVYESKTVANVSVNNTCPKLLSEVEQTTAYYAL